MTLPGTRKGLLRTLIVAVSGVILLACYYSPLFRSPNAYLFRGTGDGLKNYYAFAYHVQHDSTWMQFGGMNHPFGEQIGFPDAQPALANAVKTIAYLVPCVADHTPAIINLAALFGMVLTALSIYWILLRLRVHWGYAGLMALAITALSPQVLRMAAGHHALTYGWTITLPILFFLRVVEGGRPLRDAWIGGAITLIGLYLHPYTGMIATCLLGLAFLFLGPWRYFRNQRTKLIAIVLLLIWPIATFLVVQGITDHHAGRSAKPLGFFDYQTTVDALVMPPGDVRSPLSRWVFPGEGEQVFEGSAYIGLGALLGLLVMLPMLVISRTRKTIPPEVRQWPSTLAPLLIASLVLWLFALGHPFTKEGLTPWDVPFLGQFRSPGRFAWALYYMVGLCVAYGMWWASRHELAGRARPMMLLLTACVPALYLYEARYYHCTACHTIMHDRNVLDAAVFTPEEHALVAAVDPAGFRAILSVPNFLNGSDEVMLNGDPVISTAMLLSQRTGLPMTGYSLARTSVPETREQIGMLTPPWYPRPIKERYAATDRFLILSVGPPANAYEAAVLERSEPLGTFGEARLFSITAATLFTDRTKELFAHLDTLFGDAPITPGKWVRADGRSDVAYFPLDDHTASHSYHGAGAYEAPKKGLHVFATVPAGTLRHGEQYIASYWIEHRGTLRSHALTCIAQRDTATGHEEWIGCSDPRFARVVNGDWSLVELPFTAGTSTNEYRIFTEAAPFYNDTLLVDEVVVRPADGETIMVLSEKDGRMMDVLYNGHHLTRPR